MLIIARVFRVGRGPSRGLTEDQADLTSVTTSNQPWGTCLYNISCGLSVTRLCLFAVKQLGSWRESHMQIQAHMLVSSETMLILSVAIWKAHIHLSDQKCGKHKLHVLEVYFEVKSSKSSYPAALFYCTISASKSPFGWWILGCKAIASCGSCVLCTPVKLTLIWKIVIKRNPQIREQSQLKGVTRCELEVEIGQ